MLLVIMEGKRSGSSGKAFGTAVNPSQSNRYHSRVSEQSSQSEGRCATAGLDLLDDMVKEREYSEENNKTIARSEIGHESTECDKENVVLVINKSSSTASSSSSTPHKEWLETTDHRHLTYDEARSANRAKVMMMQSKALNVVSSSPAICYDENGDHGDGGVSRLTTVLNRRSLGSSMGGRGRGWGSACKSTLGTSPRCTPSNKQAPLVTTPNDDGTTISRRQLVDSLDNDSHRNENQDTGTDSSNNNRSEGSRHDQSSKGGHTDNFPVELIFEENPDPPV